MRRSLAITGLVAWVAGCDANGAAYPPAATLHFPASLVVTPEVDGHQFLVVSSSNFDLKYSAGTLHSFDLSALRAAVDACTDPPCAYEDLEPYLVSEVLTGSYSSGMALSPRGDRVYLAVRSELDLTWVDLDPSTGALSCESTGQPASCGDARRTAEISDACGRDLDASGDPMAVLAGSVSTLTGTTDPAQRDWVMLVHRAGTASLYLDREVGSELRPVLVDQVDGLPRDVVNASLEPSTQLVWTHSALVTSTRLTRAVGFIGVAYDETQPECSNVFAGGTLGLRGVDDGYDTRDSAFSSDGSRAWILSRRPEAVLSVDLDGTSFLAGDAAMERVIPVGAGPSRATSVVVDDREVVVASCYDGRNVWFVDGGTGQTLGVIPGFAGPYEIAVDTVGELVWVADFKDSVIRAIDYSPIHDGGEPVLVARFGAIQPVRVLR